MSHNITNTNGRYDFAFIGDRAGIWHGHGLGAARTLASGDSLVIPIGSLLVTLA